MLSAFKGNMLQHVIVRKRFGYKKPKFVLDST